MARRRKAHAEEHPDERWLITYADVLTLMFVLFMVLFSISVVNTSKFELLKQSIQVAFNSGVTSGGTSVLEGSGGAKDASILDTPMGRIAPNTPNAGGIDLAKATDGQVVETGQLIAVQRSIDAQMASKGLKGTVSTSVDQRGLAIQIKTDGVLFGSGQATLTPTGVRIITPIAAALRAIPNPIRVEGHTDDVPIATSQFPSNWALSAVRGAAVVQDMQADGIPESRLQAAGFGDSVPIASNDTAAGRARNRRVAILVLRTQGAPDGSPASAAGATANP
jgi:chemotaxis protein MotB